MIFLKAAQFAELNHEQLNEIKSLEEKLDITLIAYELSLPEITSHNENKNPVINPS